MMVWGLIGYPAGCFIFVWCNRALFAADGTDWRLFSSCIPCACGQLIRRAFYTAGAT